MAPPPPGWKADGAAACGGDGRPYLLVHPATLVGVDGWNSRCAYEKGPRAQVSVCSLCKCEAHDRPLPHVCVVHCVSKCLPSACHFCEVHKENDCRRGCVYETSIFVEHQLSNGSQYRVLARERRAGGACGMKAVFLFLSITIFHAADGIVLFPNVLRV